MPGESGFAKAVDFSSVVIRKEPPLQRLDTLRVYPETVVISPGGRSLLSVLSVDELGKPIGDLSISWNTTLEGIGEINSNGSFKAGYTPGIYHDALAVTVQQQLDSDIVTKISTANVIISGPLTQLKISPPLATIVPGRAIHFSVIGKDKYIVSLPGLVVRWHVSDADVGTIDPFGNFIAGETPGLYKDAVIAEVIQNIPNSK